MSKAMMFEHAVIYNPKPVDGKTEKSSFVIPMYQFLAKSELEATIVAARAIPEEYMDRIEDLQIILRRAG